MKTNKKSWEQKNKIEMPEEFLCSLAPIQGKTLRNKQEYM